MQDKKSVLTVKELVMLAIIGALMVASQVLMASLPNINLISMLIILATLSFGIKAFVLVSMFVVLEGLL